jgi:hypothetical protein
MSDIFLRQVLEKAPREPLIWLSRQKPNGW